MNQLRWIQKKTYTHFHKKYDTCTTTSQLQLTKNIDFKINNTKKKHINIKWQSFYPYLANQIEWVQF